MLLLWTTKPLFTALLITLFLAGCTRMSEHEKDPGAGLNGGFEVVKNGLPVNWLMYTPNTAPEADFDIILDREDYKEGKQSLKFEVRESTGRGGWHAPGFTNEFFDTGRFYGPGKYLVSFWIKNDGTTFNVSAGGVAEKTGGMETLIETGASIDEWTYYEFVVEVPEEHWLRLQLNVLKPGNFWIDDVRISAL